MTETEKKRKRAEAAKKKSATYGEDIDLDEYEFSQDQPRRLELDEVSEQDRELVSGVGFDASGQRASGSFLQFDNESILADVMIGQEGLEVIPTNEALKKYDWLSDYLWNAVAVDTDKYTATSELERYDGYFIRAKAGHKVEMPVQTCLVLKKGKSIQNVHNIIIAEEGSEMHIITGCATPSDVEHSLHLGVSEFYVKGNAKLTFTMVHKWSDKVDVRPRSATIVEDNGVFVSSYAVLSPLRSIQTFPKVRLAGRNSHADLYSVVYGTKQSKYDIGGALILEAPATSGKIISRSIATEQSEIIARGDLIGKHTGAKARLECNGLLLSDEAEIGAVPALRASSEGVELSHEATVGKVGAEQLNYLMSRGLTEEEATTIIVNGFVQLKAPNLPPSLQKSIDDAIKLTLEKGL
ncbi:SufD family Fe-S cluster assembly protein [Candidatus Thorarchaeota archaeon]|nr:MAG: SufD family Fe-S cluster assembly protein [Candidatus Thorarchaeota archaeon]